MTSFDWRGLGRAIPRKVTHNWLLKLGSIAFAVGLWGFVNLGAREADRSITVPLEFRNLPPKLMITSPIPDAVDVRLRGPRTILGTIDERRQRVSINLSNVATGTTSFKIDADMLNLPRGVAVTRLAPVQVTLEVQRIIERMLPVVSNLTAAVPAGYRLVESEVRPAVVTVNGPAAQVQALRNVPVGPLHLPLTTGNFEETVALERPADLIRLSPDRVVVRGVLEELVITQDFRNVDIGVRNPPRDYHMRPRNVDVTIRGPQRLIRELRLSSQNFYVDLADMAPGYHAKRIEATVPQGLEVLEIRPPETTVEVAGEPEAPRKRRTAKEAKPR
jgi:YbbR domain-containing protein